MAPEMQVNPPYGRQLLLGWVPDDTTLFLSAELSTLNGALVPGHLCIVLTHWRGLPKESRLSRCLSLRLIVIVDFLLGKQGLFYHLTPTVSSANKCVPRNDDLAPSECSQQPAWLL